MVSEEYLALLDEMKNMHKTKNAGYSGIGDDSWANFRNAELFGVSPFNGCMVRMSDKYTRIANLVQNPKLDEVGESITDTLLDLASYALIGICLYREEERKLKEKKKIYD